jgi:ribosomal protein S18 acetylase RimI-like enzyme
VTLHIKPAGREHLAAVREAYADARVLQREQAAPLWPEFSDDAILAELEAGHLFRVLDGDALAGIFSVVYEDPAIWGDRERGAHVYLHRIARVAAYQGRGLLGAVLEWGRSRCRELGRDGLRMDTWSSNTALIAYYERHGFRLAGRRVLGADARLPAHYHGIELALLEESP